ncbi:DUF4126 domain-containing protein [Mycetohabitans sp. B5]|uniref:Uncharacterized protein DUF4126 n=1 Tax=Mycetohabitans endofungorum TaxID=417203 RepID=A0A2P5K8M5_9BURK|nr:MULTISPECIES: DUF4126 domain-containing protein [Mycetohabitans]MCG1055326.1 DUF4126 domain-containing protein [Mycetohabitans sp. B5]PPB83068.1 uncharacterized protein DUF4126 [Mycetohabitans endofungorum]
MLYALSLATGLAWASGLRLYLTVLLTGLLASFDAVRLPDALSLLGSPWIIGAAALLAIAEFLADKVPAVDSLWDALHTLIRIPAGAMLAYGAAGHADPRVLAAAALAGAAIAGTAHLVKAGARALINLAQQPASTWVVSFVEDTIAVLGLLLALFMPGLFLLGMLVFLAFAAYALPPLWHGVQLGFRGMATDMVPVRRQLSPLAARVSRGRGPRG